MAVVVEAVFVVAVEGCFAIELAVVMAEMVVVTVELAVVTVEMEVATVAFEVVAFAVGMTVFGFSDFQVDKTVFQY